MEGMSMGSLLVRFKHFPRELQDILFEFRSLILGIRPDAAERVDARGLSYFDHRVGRAYKGALAILHIAEDHLQVHMIYGARLSDPSALLDGGKDAKYKRFARIYSMESADWKGLGALIQAHIELVQGHLD